jgi:hypothetical protein
MLHYGTFRNNHVGLKGLLAGVVADNGKRVPPPASSSLSARKIVSSSFRLWLSGFGDRVNIRLVRCDAL